MVKSHYLVNLSEMSELLKKLVIASNKGLNFSTNVLATSSLTATSIVPLDDSIFFLLSILVTMPVLNALAAS